MQDLTPTSRGRRRNVRLVAFALAGLVALAAGGWAAARQIRSPAQVAADTAPPKPSLISVPVERRSLATEVIVRGTVRYGSPQPVVLAASDLKTATTLVTRAPRLGTLLHDRSVALSVSGRPVFVLRGAIPMHRDLAPGVEGRDVMQLERELARAGFAAGAVDGRYDGATAGAVAAFYRRNDETPFGMTDLQAEKLRTADATAAAARDALLQTRLALRTARRGTTKAELSQAQLDAVAAGEAVPPARLAIGTAQEKIAAATDAQAAAERQAAEARTTSGSDVAAADAELTSRNAAVTASVHAQGEAQLALNTAPADTPPAELQLLREALQRAVDAVGVARAAVSSATAALGAAQASGPRAVAQAQADAARAVREIARGQSEVRGARQSLAIALRKRALAHARLGILRATPDTTLERRIVAAAAADVRRTRAEADAFAMRAGVQVPADELLFFATLPVRVDQVKALRGSQAAGRLMTVTQSRLAIDSSLSVSDAKLVRPGMPVKIDEQDLGVRAGGTVSVLADRPGTRGVDPQRTYVEVAPRDAPRTLLGASVKLSIAVRSSKGKVLAVPVGALSAVADGSSRVQLDMGGGRTRFITVVPGLAAAGFVEVKPAPGARLKAGDLVVVGRGAGNGRP